MDQKIDRQRRSGTARSTPATHARDRRARPVRAARLRQHADLSRLDGALSQRGGIPASATRAITYGTQGHADHRGAGGRLDTNSTGARRRPCCCRSGLAAISTALLSVPAEPATTSWSPTSVYRPTRNFCDTILKRFGVETTYYDPLIGAGIATLIQPNTRAVFTEAPGSLVLRDAGHPGHRRGRARARRDRADGQYLGDAAVISAPHRRTASTSSIEAGTKYIGGAFRPAARPRLGQRALLEAPARRPFDSIGLCAGPEDVFLALRGLRTHERCGWRTSSESALAVARWLASAGRRSRACCIPALESHPGHAIWKRDFTGASALFSIVLKPVPQTAVHAFIDALELFGIGASWGGFESLAIPFDCAPFRTATPWEPGGPTRALPYRAGRRRRPDRRSRARLRGADAAASA